MKSTLAAAVVSLSVVSLFVSFAVASGEARTPRPPSDPNSRQVEQIYERVAANCGIAIPPAQVDEIKGTISGFLRHQGAIKAYDAALQDCQYSAQSSDGSVLARWYNDDYVKPGRKLVEWGGSRDDTPEKRLAEYRALRGTAKLLVDQVREAIADGFDDDTIENFIEGVDDLTLTKVTVELKPTPELYNLSVGVGGGNGYEFYYQVEAGQAKLVFKDFDGDIEFNSFEYQLRDLSGEYTPAVVLQRTRSAQSVQATLYDAFANLQEVDSQARRPVNYVHRGGRGTWVAEDGLARVECSARPSGIMPVQNYGCSFSHTTFAPERTPRSVQGALWTALDELHKSNPDSAVQVNRSTRFVEDESYKLTCTTTRAGQGAGKNYQCELEAK